jgi:hypothetical protein
MMSRFRRPANKEGENALPHESDREKGQPYAKETEEYSGKGVVRPPKEQVGKRDERAPRDK